MVDTKSQIPNVEPVVEGACEEEVNSEPTMLKQIQTFMVDMMGKQEEKIMGRIREMLEAQGSRLISEVKRVYGEPTVSKVGGGNHIVTTGGDGTKTFKETSQGEKEESNKGCSYNDFCMCKPPIYNGELDVGKLYNWIVDMEMAFYTCQSLESQKVNFAISMLKEEALDWWLELKEKVNLEELEKMSWEEFLEKMEEKFCSKDEIHDLEREFMNLKKEGMSVKEYNAKFRKLLNFSRKLASDEATKVDFYKGGLPWNFKLSFGDPRDMNHAMRKAREIEMTLGERDQERLGGKRKSEDFKAKERVSGSKKPRSEGKTLVTYSQGLNLEDIKCRKCQKKGHFANNCPTTKCYECGEMGHISTKCPKKTGVKSGGRGKKEEPSVKSRAFKRTNVEGGKEEDVVSGTSLVDSNLAVVLLITGVTHSFEL